MDFATENGAAATAQQLEELSTPKPHEDVTINPPAEPGGASSGGDFIMPELDGVFNDLQSIWASQLLPRAKAIEAEVANLTYEANGVTDRAEAEKTEVLKELSRLSELVLNFQSRISQFLHFGAGFGGGR